VEIRATRVELISPGLFVDIGMFSMFALSNTVLTFLLQKRSRFGCILD
jgi:hypothetical protein